MHPKSFKMEVFTGSWSSNSCRYATEAEAVEAGRELLSRWWVPTDSRATPSEDPVNYRFDFTAYRTVAIENVVAA
jgi:hypothetical protein